MKIIPFSALLIIVVQEQAAVIAELNTKLKMLIRIWRMPTNVRFCCTLTLILVL